MYHNKLRVRKYGSNDDDADVSDDELRARDHCYADVDGTKYSFLPVYSLGLLVMVAM